MTTRTKMLLTGIALSFAATGMAEVEMDRLGKSIDALRSYAYGNTGGVDLRWVETQIGMAANDPSVRGSVEDKLISALAAATTNDARQFFCRQLRTIGTEKAVPQLESMLTDPAISHMARYALGRIDAPEAGRALHRALGKTSGQVKAGIINTLAKMYYRPAATDILALLDSRDEDIAIAAVKAVGSFGGGEAVAALQKARRTATGEMCVEIDAALLNCAAKFAADGKNRQAAQIYEEYYRVGHPEHLRVAGLQGLAMTRGEEAVELLVEAIKGDDAALRRNAIGIMAQTEGQKTTDTFVELAKSLPPDGQELIVRALAERGDVSVVPAVIDMIDSEDVNVRLAALETLGDLATPAAIRHLAAAAARDESRERQVARASLIRMRGPEIEDAFVREVNTGDSGSRVEVIRAIGQRDSSTPFATLLDVAQTDQDAPAREEAILSLGRIGSPAELATLVELAVAPKESNDRSAVQRAIVILFNKIQDRDAQAAPVLHALKTAPDDAKAALLRLLTKPATSEALAAVLEEVGSANSTVSDAAIRTLGEWPDAAPAEALYRIASSSPNEVHKILALRSYIRMAPLTADPTQTFVRAVKLASRSDEIRLVLAGLHHAGSLTALEMAEKYMTDEDLKAEAYLAAVRVANVYCWQDAGRARGVLEKAIAEAPNDHVKDQAREVIEKMARYAGFVVAWKGAGPFTVDGMNDGQAVFRTTFVPEQSPEAEDVVWRVVLPEFEGDSRINLEKTFGGIDYCCAYLRTIVHCPTEQEAKVEWAADDYIRGWINGVPIEGDKLRLRTGANTLMLKVGDHGGGWNFRCRLAKPDGSSIEGLTIDPK